MKKNVVKINEDTLRKIVAESVKKVLKEDFDNNEKRVDDVMRNLLLQTKAAYQRLDRISSNRGGINTDSDALKRAFNVVLGCEEIFKNNGFNLQTYRNATSEEPSWGAEDEG